MIPQSHSNQTFPLPAGCREVCRPQRNKVRHFNLKSLLRVVQSILANETATPEEVCKTMHLFPELAYECKPDCRKLKALVNGWLREFEFIDNQYVGLLDSFVADLIGE